MGRPWRPTCGVVIASDRGERGNLIPLSLRDCAACPEPRRGVSLLAMTPHACHCERSEAISSCYSGSVDCFVAPLLAMTRAVGLSGQ